MSPTMKRRMSEGNQEQVLNFSPFHFLLNHKDGDSLGTTLRKMFNSKQNRPLSMSMESTLTTSVSFPLKSQLTICDKDDWVPLTKEMMLEWKTPNVGFEKLLATKEGRKLFDDFLKKEHSAENLHFWIACERLKMVSEEKKFNDHVEFLFKIYIEPSAINEVDGVLAVLCSV